MNLRGSLHGKVTCPQAVQSSRRDKLNSLVGVESGRIGWVIVDSMVDRGGLMIRVVGRVDCFGQGSGILGNVLGGETCILITSHGCLMMNWLQREVCVGRIVTRVNTGVQRGCCCRVQSHDRTLWKH